MAVFILAGGGEIAWPRHWGLGFFSSGAQMGIHSGRGNEEPNDPRPHLFTAQFPSEAPT